MKNDRPSAEDVAKLRVIAARCRELLGGSSNQRVFRALCADLADRVEAFRSYVEVAATATATAKTRT